MSKKQEKVVHQLSQDQIEESVDSETIASSLGFALSDPKPVAEIVRLRKSLPGYASVVKDAKAQLEKDAEVLAVCGVTPASLEKLSHARAPLSYAETVLQTAYRSAYEQRLVLDDQGIGALRKINNVVASSKNKKLIDRWKFLNDYLAVFSRGAGKSDVTEPVAPDAPEAPAVAKT